MKHPTHEQWMEFLYGEMSAPDRAALEQHALSCAECQAKRSEFSNVIKHLDSWRLDEGATRSVSRSPWALPAKWAAAAAAVVLLSAAFAAGRWSKPSVDQAALQAEIGRQVDQRLNGELEKRLNAAFETRIAPKLQEFSDRTVAEAAAVHKKQIGEFVVQLAALREEDRKAIFANLQRLEARQLTDYRALRADLEKVALFSDESIREAQRKLVRLASLNSRDQE